MPRSRGTPATGPTRPARRRRRGRAAVASSRTLRSAAAPPLRRSSRLAALEERRRETEENALRQQRERIAQTHRHVSRNNFLHLLHDDNDTESSSSSTRSRRSSTPGTQLTSFLSRPQLQRQPAIRRRHGVSSARSRPTIPQLQTIEQRREAMAQLIQDVSRMNNNHFDNPPPRRRYQTARMTTGGINSARMEAMRRAFPRVIPMSGESFAINHPEFRDSVFNFGLILGNRYSSDSEESFFQPRIIDPDAISEDESETEEVNPISTREATPHPIAAEAAAAAEVRRPITRSMSSQPGFIDGSGPSSSSPSSSTATPGSRLRATMSKRPKVKPDPYKCKSGPSSVKSVIKVETVTPCTICYEDDPKKPVACSHCRQSIGCRYCVKKWFYTTNMSHLDSDGRMVPYRLCESNRNHKRCPLCRADWGNEMQIVSVTTTQQQH